MLFQFTDLTCQQSKWQMIKRNLLIYFCFCLNIMIFFLFFSSFLNYLIFFLFFVNWLAINWVSLAVFLSYFAVVVCLDEKHKTFDRRRNQNKWCDWQRILLYSRNKNLYIIFSQSVGNFPFYLSFKNDRPSLNETLNENKR